MRITIMLGALAVGLAARRAGALDVNGAEAQQTLRAPPERMQQWNEWKFGLFIHWGPWSQTHKGGIWAITGGRSTPESKEREFNLYKSFNPVKFDPAAWARLAREAGMLYVVFVTKHHDGFCNFDTAQTDFKITNPECPYSRSPRPDLTAEVVKAFRAESFGIGLYFSHIDFHHPDGAWHKNHRAPDPEYLAKTLHWETFAHPQRWRRFFNFEREQVREILTRYGEIDVVWFDIRWPARHPVVRNDITELVRTMKRLSPDVIINNRGTHGTFEHHGSFATPEQNIPGKPPPGYWETCMTISQGGGFWYKGPEARYKSSRDVILKLAEIASKGGNFLLNVGPKPDGTLPQGEIDCLKGVGRWMAVNGEAIHGTTRSPWGAPPEWGYITRGGERIYLIVTKWPKGGGALPLALRAEKIRGARLLAAGAGGASVPHRTDASGRGVEFVLPGEPPGDPPPVVAVDCEAELGVEARWPRPQKKGHK